MTWLWMLSLTAGAAPDRVATSISVGSQVVDVIAAEDRSTVAVLNGAGGVSLMDLGTWDLRTVTPCTDVGGIAQAPGEPGRFWAGCGDGTLQWFELGDDGPEVGSEGVDLAEEAMKIIDEVESVGGMTQAIVSGMPKMRIEESAARR